LALWHTMTNRDRKRVPHFLASATKSTRRPKFSASHLSPSGGQSLAV
jgi:hypothetical protein